jgi:DNA polymerase-3 subunit delta
MQELAKIALYAGASPDSPKTVERATLEEIGAGWEGDWTRLGDLALSGELGRLSHELEASAADADPIMVLRALQRRLMMLAPIRAKVDAGVRPHDAVTSAGKSVFFKEKELVTRLVSLWDSKALERAFERSGALERRLMSSNPPPATEAIEEELVAIAVMARRR